MGENTFQQSKPKKKSNKRLGALIIGVSIVLIGIAGVIAIRQFAQNQSNDNTVNTDNAKAQENQARMSTTKAAADTAGGVDKGLAVYDSAIKGASEEEVAQLYTEKSFFALNNNDVDAAIVAAEEAIAKDGGKTNGPYFAAAKAYELKGDYQKALDNYQKALDTYNKISKDGNTGVAVSYERKISAMKAKLQ